MLLSIYKIVNYQTMCKTAIARPQGIFRGFPLYSRKGDWKAVDTHSLWDVRLVERVREVDSDVRWLKKEQQMFCSRSDF